MDFVVFICVILLEANGDAASSRIFACWIVFYVLKNRW